MNRIPTLGGLSAELRSRWPEWTTISVFAAVVAFAIPYHEPWADEAQAWQLARSLSLRELFQTYIRYEATPGLWHFLLWIMNRVHVSYAGMHWICGLIAVVAASLLVLNSPFPRYLKLTLPFTFFLLFQYAVIARSYLLVPLLLFVIASWWKKSPLVVAVALGLLANCALHAAAISGGLAIVWLVEQLRAGSAKTSESRRKLLLCAMIVLGFYAFAIWTAWPPNDLVYLSFSRAAKPSFLHSALASVLAPICQPVILSIPFWIAIVFVFGARRSLLYLLPVLFFAAFSGNVIGYFWHWGLVVPLLICLLWITWSSPGADMSLHEFVGRAALIYMVGVQIIWSAYALNFDHYSAYSPNLTTAQFLRPRVEAGATIAVTYLDESHSPFAASHIFSATGILPYFDRSIYINQSYPFYWWSEKNKSDELFYALLPSHPSVVVAEALQVENGPAIDLKGQRAELLRNSGYQLTNVFCGSLPFRMELVLTNCHVIFQRSDSRQEPSGIAPGPTSTIK
jgi:hypothetical protein